MDEVNNHIDHLIDYTINYFRQIRKKYSKGKERRTEIRNFDNIEASMVAVANEKLFVNREDGFAGTSLKKDEYVCECSDIDDIIVFRRDGTFIVTKVATKTFVGKDIIHIDVFKRNDDRTIYNMIYRDGYKGRIYVKRFPVLGVTRAKEYDLTKGTKGTRVLYFTANPNGEAEVLRVRLRPKPRLRKLSFEFDFKDLDIRNRNAKGNILTRHAILDISKKEEGVSTLGAIDIWYDETVKRINTEDRGEYLGAFKGNDRILTVMKSGVYKLTNYDVSTHFDEDMIVIQKFNPSKIITVFYFEGSLQKYYVKRFIIDPDTHENKKVKFIGDHKDSVLVAVSFDHYPRAELEFKKVKGKKPVENEVIDVGDFIAVKSENARGKRLTNKEIKNIKLLEPLPYEQETENSVEDEQIEADEKGEKEIENNHENQDAENDKEQKNDNWQMTLDL
jgi:topoisomerase-4 subunit A